MCSFDPTAGLYTLRAAEAPSGARLGAATWASANDLWLFGGMDSSSGGFPPLFIVIYSSLMLHNSKEILTNKRNTKGYVDVQHRN